MFPQLERKGVGVIDSACSRALCISHRASQSTVAVLSHARTLNIMAASQGISEGEMRHPG